MPLFLSRLVEAKRACDDFLQQAGTSGPWKREMLRRAPTVYEKSSFNTLDYGRCVRFFIFIKSYLN